MEPGVVEYKRKDDAIVDASQRPTRFDYDRYYFIVQERARLGFAPPRTRPSRSSFRTLPSHRILCRAEADLAELCRALGLESKATERHARLERAIQTKLYDAATATYHDFDVLGGTPIKADHVAMMIPLFAGIAPPAAVERACARLTDETAYAPPFAIPSVPLSAPEFDARRYCAVPRGST